MNIEKQPKKPKPGDILFDRNGIVSHSVPATYVVLSGEQIDVGPCRRWEYRCWCARDCADEWMGGPVVVMFDSDLERTEFVGRVPMAHIEEAKP